MAITVEVKCEGRSSLFAESLTIDSVSGSHGGPEVLRPIGTINLSTRHRKTARESADRCKGLRAMRLLHSLVLLKFIVSREPLR